MKLQILILVVLIVIVLLWSFWFLKVDTPETPKKIITSDNVATLDVQTPPMTGKLKITTQNEGGDANCDVKLGDMYDPMVGQLFSATWNDAKIPSGGYILTWGPTALFYGLKKPRMFDENLVVVTQSQYEQDGKGFAIARGGVIPCECCGDKSMKTPFKLTPIRNLSEVKTVTFSRSNEDVHVEFQKVSDCDTYVVSVVVQRESSQSPSFAYHGVITQKQSVDIRLPSYDWSENTNFGRYDDSIEVKVFGYNFREVGNTVSARAGNFAVFKD